MALYLGAIGFSDTDRVFGETKYKRLIYTEVNRALGVYNAELNAALSLFVDRDTVDYQLRYKLPGVGFLEERGPNSRPGLMKANGGWDVGFPLQDFAAGIGGNDVALAYSTYGDLDRHFGTVLNSNAHTIRHHIMKRIFVNTVWNFSDPIYGTISVQPLANGDGTLYPPVIGSTTEADATLHVESGYAASAISETNNPIVTIVGAIETRFGTPTGGSNIAIFCNSAQAAKLTALADFVSVVDMAVIPGDQTPVPVGLPAKLAVKGASWRVLGRFETNGAWLVQWVGIPANYLVGLHLDLPAPLYRRIDMPDTGLTPDLQLVGSGEVDDWPFEQTYWRNRCGFGVANRLNGYVMELGTGGTYTIPTVYQ